MSAKESLVIAAGAGLILSLSQDAQASANTNVDLTNNSRDKNTIVIENELSSDRFQEVIDSSTKEIIEVLQNSEVDFLFQIKAYNISDSDVSNTTQEDIVERTNLLLQAAINSGFSSLTLDRGVDTIIAEGKTWQVPTLRFNQDVTIQDLAFKKNSLVIPYLNFDESGLAHLQIAVLEDLDGDGNTRSTSFLIVDVDGQGFNGIGIPTIFEQNENGDQKPLAILEPVLEDGRITGSKLTEIKEATTQPGPTNVRYLGTEEVDQAIPQTDLEILGDNRTRVPGQEGHEFAIVVTPEGKVRLVSDKLFVINEDNSNASFVEPPANRGSEFVSLNNFDRISGLLNTEQSITYRELLSAYPDQNIDRVLKHAPELGITVIGWNAGYSALEGVTANGEHLFFYPRLGSRGYNTNDLEARAEDDAISGWSRLEPPISSSDYVPGVSGARIILATAREFEYKGENSKVCADPLIYTNQQATDNFIDRTQSYLPEIEPGDQVIILTTPDDLTHLGTGQGDQELPRRVNNLGVFQVYEHDGVAAGTTLYGNTHINMVSESKSKERKYDEDDDNRGSFAFSTMSAGLVKPYIVARIPNFNSFSSTISSFDQLGTLQPPVSEAILYPVYREYDQTGETWMFSVCPVNNSNT